MIEDGLQYGRYDNPQIFVSSFIKHPDVIVVGNNDDGKELAERKVDLCTENYNKILRSQEILREKASVLESYSRPKELTRSMVETFIDHIVICSSSDGTSKQEIKIYWNF